MTVEEIEKRKTELKAQLDQLLANASALQGAIQDCDYWLAVLEEESGEANNLPVNPE